MRKRDRRVLGAYMRDVADRMELRDWHLDLSREHPSDASAYATCYPVYGQRRAVLRFCENFRDLRPEEQRDIVVHELVHCHLAAAQNQLENDLERHLSAATEKVFFDSFHRNVEYAVDGLAHAISKHMPTIEW